MDSTWTPQGVQVHFSCEKWVSHGHWSLGNSLWSPGNSQDSTGFCMERMGDCKELHHLFNLCTAGSRLHIVLPPSSPLTYPPALSHSSSQIPALLKLHSPPCTVLLFSLCQHQQIFAFSTLRATNCNLAFSTLTSAFIVYHSACIKHCYCYPLVLCFFIYTYNCISMSVDSYQ